MRNEDREQPEGTSTPPAVAPAIERPFAVGTTVPRVGATGLIALLVLSYMSWILASMAIPAGLVALASCLFMALLFVPFALSLTSTVTFTVEAPERRIAKRLCLFGVSLNVRWIAFDDVACLQPADESTSLYLVTRSGKRECLLYRTFEETVAQEADRLVKILGTRIC